MIKKHPEAEGDIGSFLPIDQDSMSVSGPGAPYELKALTKEQQQEAGWTLTIAGEKVADVPSAVLAHPKMEIALGYGMGSEGWDGIAFKEPGGGGDVTIPFMIHPETHEIYVGLVHIDRPKAGGMVWEVPRGFLDPEESHGDAARRELQEETGYRAAIKKVVKLAEGLNPNTTFFVTAPEEGDDSREKRGVSIYSVQVDRSELEEIKNADGTTTFTFPQETQDKAVGDAAGERILGSRFVPLEYAMTSPDMFTSAAGGQLMAAIWGSMRSGRDTDELKEARQVPSSISG